MCLCVCVIFWWSMWFFHDYFYLKTFTNFWDQSRWSRICGLLIIISKIEHTSIYDFYWNCPISINHNAWSFLSLFLIIGIFGQKSIIWFIIFKIILNKTEHFVFLYLVFFVMPWITIENNFTFKHFFSYFQKRNISFSIKK